MTREILAVNVKGVLDINKNMYVCQKCHQFGTSKNTYRVNEALANGVEERCISCQVVIRRELWTEEHGSFINHEV